MYHSVGWRLLAGTLLAGGVWIGWSSQPEIGCARSVARVSQEKFGYVGTASCAATACHNQGGPPGSPRSEYSTWMLHDRHVRAYDALLTERSKRILMNLRGLKDMQDAHPEKDFACLQCHSLDPHGAQQGQRIALEDGIGCERCHGPAQKWLTEHFSRAWKEKSTAEKAALGFVPAQSLTARAQMCVECHVGSGDRDVNHDLIAAGHPRLLFEYSSFLAQMPPHWNFLAEKQRQPDLEARHWVAGQIVAAQQALELLARRAQPEPQTSHSVWPEFAEYDCYACHNPISSSRRQATRSASERPAGSAAVCDWYWVLVPRALSLAGHPEAARVQTTLTELRREMSQAASDRDRVAALARSAAALLQQTRAGIERMQRLEPGTLQRALADILREESGNPAASWDRAAQVYLAVVALQQASLDQDPRQRQPQVRAQLHALGHKLRFRPGYDSPRAEDLADFWSRLPQLPLR